MKLLGLIGFPLTHSFSKSYFNSKFERENLDDFKYENFPIENIMKLTTIIEQNPDLIGINVTIPYKEKVLTYLNEQSEAAIEIGAVNVIRITRKDYQYQLKGFNTDYIGFTETLRPHLQPNHKKALILGTGGSSKAVAYALKQLQIDYKFVTREKKTSDNLTYNDINKKTIEEYNLIINTTPLGMYPNIAYFPLLPYDGITEKHVLFDLIYNPPETKFLKLGRERGATTINGQKMLEIQADESWKIFSDLSI